MGNQVMVNQLKKSKVMEGQLMGNLVVEDQLCWDRIMRKQLKDLSEFNTLSNFSISLVFKKICK